jgi:hypothetical protein
VAHLKIRPRHTATASRPPRGKWVGDSSLAPAWGFRGAGTFTEGGARCPQREVLERPGALCEGGIEQAMVNAPAC